MLHIFYVISVATFVRILGALNMAEGFDAAHHSYHDGDLI